MDLREVRCTTILNRTGGFLAGFSHSCNPYSGCAFGNALCGVACYAPALRHGDPRPWGSYLEAKVNAAEMYRAQVPRERRRGPVRVFCASVTDPWVPQERRLRVTRRLLEAMADDPPDALVLQTHTPGPLDDLDVLATLHARCALTVQISVETDRDAIPGLPPHVFPVAVRLDGLRALKERGLRAVGVVAPLLPLDDPQGFAAALDDACTAVIVDHWLVGDGSRGGARTLARGLPARLEAAGLGRWNTLAALEETVAVFRDVLGDARVGVSREGFNRFAAGAPADPAARRATDPTPRGAVRR